MVPATVAIIFPQKETPSPVSQVTLDSIKLTINTQQSKSSKKGMEVEGSLLGDRKNCGRDGWGEITNRGMNLIETYCVHVFVSMNPLLCIMNIC